MKRIRRSVRTEAYLGKYQDPDFEREYKSALSNAKWASDTVSSLVAKLQSIRAQGSEPGDAKSLLSILDAALSMLKSTKSAVEDFAELID